MSGNEEPLQPPGRPLPWTFLTNHSHVLVCVHRDGFARVRDIALEVRITERAVQRIIKDLEEAGVLSRVRDGRRNRYQIHPTVHLRHPLEAHRTIGEVLDLLGPTEGA